MTDLRRAVFRAMVRSQELREIPSAQRTCAQHVALRNLERWLEDHHPAEAANQDEARAPLREFTRADRWKLAGVVLVGLIFLGQLLGAALF